MGRCRVPSGTVQRDPDRPVDGQVGGLAGAVQRQPGHPVDHLHARDEQVSSAGVGMPQRRTTAGSPQAATPGQQRVVALHELPAGQSDRAGRAARPSATCRPAVVAPGASTDETASGSVDVRHRPGIDDRRPAR